jgi:hypothetical protein
LAQHRPAKQRAFEAWFCVRQARNLFDVVENRNSLLRSPGFDECFGGVDQIAEMQLGIFLVANTC